MAAQLVLVQFVEVRILAGQPSSPKFISLLTMILRIYWILFFAAISICSGNEASLSLEALLDKYYNAQGGLNALFQIKSLRTSGTIYMDGDDYQLTVIKKAPNKVRKILKKNNRTYIEAYNGKVAWRKSPDAAAEIIPNEAATSLIESAPILNHLTRAKEEGIKVTLVDTKSFVGTVPCYHIRLVLPSNGAIEYFIGTDDFWERKIIYENTIEGKLQINISEFSQHKAVKDFIQPFLIKSKTEGQTSSSFDVESIDINVGVSSQYFEFPENLSSGTQAIR